MAESPYPPYIPLRTIVWGRALQMETTRPLRVETTTHASRPLTWAATAESFFPAGEVRIPPTGEEAVIEVPRTDLSGWVDPITGAPLDPGLGPSHTYTTTVRVYDGERVVDEYTVGPYAAPAGTGVIDGDLLRFAGDAPAQATAAAPWDLTGGQDFPPYAATGDWGIDLDAFRRADGKLVIRTYRKG
ncbi:hypothetical protein B0I12_002575 [Microbacterium hydrothermale]|uniref:hypothetical protein n=1 Tax=Microbacterium hydrothermale TaxID=857427 RepID=UPI002226492A|nr:hypothetical protein [Microbacterium hydrothermale]MCW2165420.1 hypothetical protein [Microbacterium hydrothermale]